MLETIIGFGGVFWLDSLFCCMDGQNMKNVINKMEKLTVTHSYIKPVEVNE